MFLPSDVSLMKWNDSQQPKGAEPIRRGDRRVGELSALMEIIRTSTAKAKTNNSTWHNLQSKLDCLWLYLALHAD